MAKKFAFQDISNICHHHPAFLCLNLCTFYVNHANLVCALTGNRENTLSVSQVESEAPAATTDNPQNHRMVILKFWNLGLNTVQCFRYLHRCLFLSKITVRPHSQHSQSKSIGQVSFYFSC